MAALMVFLVISWLNFGSDLHNKLAALGAHPHKICLNLTPDHTQWHAAYDALVCGEPLPVEPLRQSFVAVGVIHLMVVSGLHLAFMEHWLTILICRINPFRHPFLRSIVLILLSIYCAICLFPPPATRAFIGVVLGLANRHYKWQWPPSQRVALTGVICLAIFPDWWSSPSLVLSWTAALALAVASSQPLLSNLLVYLFVLPPLLPLGVPHPASVFINTLLAPALSQVLFPASLIATILPWLSALTDWLWMATAQLVNFLATQIPSPTSPLPTNKTFLWLYLLGLHLICLGWEFWQKEKHSHE